MVPTREGSFHLWRFAGIDVFLHWSWFLVAAWAVSVRSSIYSSFLWNVLEYLALFMIVVMHEYGHSLACRQVGGQANQIVLWPLGGVAYVAPPPRPGPTLWSIAAGPLVNLLLLPVLTGIVWLAQSLGWTESMPNFYSFLEATWIINLILLIFNLLPIYPLDGGQILRSLLWFMVGRARSLMVTSIIGFVGVAVLVLLALWARSIWFGVLCLFIALHCWKGYKEAQSMMRTSKAPRRAGLACPSCKAAPPVGGYWRCGRCGKPFDSFETMSGCPHCGAQFALSICPACGGAFPLNAWMDSSRTPPTVDV